jgi:lantibiotic leader peptide-processing serine protease
MQAKGGALSRKSYGRALVFLLTAALALALAGTAGATRYIVVLKTGNEVAGVRAVERAGGNVVAVNKVGVATVTASDASFDDTLRASSVVAAVGLEAAWRVQGPSFTDVISQVPGPEMATGCAQQYEPPGGVGVGPDALSVCQWDMRIMNASPTGSYAVNRGEGADVAILDTGVDYTHADIAPNFDLARSCSFIYPGNPAADPRDLETPGSCETKTAVQDYFGHGAHVAGIVAAPINGLGVAGVAPEATVASLKVCTTVGYCFAQPVTDALIYAGDNGFDVANMSFFVDPYLYNCRNEEDQRASWLAVHRAAQYATQRGVVLVASAGNHASDLDHPPETDETSPNFPPGEEEEREINNACVVVPAELPTTATISSIGPERELAFYSAYGHSKVDVTAPGGASDQAPNPYGRVLNVWSHFAPPLSTANRRFVEDCQTVGGAPVCAFYGWIQGTSMSAPHAAGVAALIRAREPWLPPVAVIARMELTAMPMTCPPEDERCSGNDTGTGKPHTSFYGSGLVDALAASVQ